MKNDLRKVGVCSQFVSIVTRYTMKAVELEAKSTTSESLRFSFSLTFRESKREAKREWREAHEKELKERRLRGITEKNA